MKYELLWDFANYHYYNPWAFLNGRVGYDIAPASVNTYSNPLIEIPFYYMVKYLNDYPGVVSALQGMYFGILVFMVFKIAELFFLLRCFCMVLSERLFAGARFLAKKIAGKVMENFFFRLRTF